MKRMLASLMLVVWLGGCSSMIESQNVTLSNGSIATYVFGKIAGDGQEAVFRDAFIEGVPVLTHFGSGASLSGQVLHGAAAAAMIGGGMAGASALRRPDRYNNTTSNNINNDSNSTAKQSQKQQQGQLQWQEGNAVATGGSGGAGGNGGNAHPNNGGGNGGEDGSPNGHDDSDQ